MPKMLFSDSTGGAYSAPPDPLAGFQGPTSKGRGLREGEGRGREGKEKERERRWEGKGGERERGKVLPQPPKAGDATGAIIDCFWLLIINTIQCNTINDLSADSVCYCQSVTVVFLTIIRRVRIIVRRSVVKGAGQWQSY